MNIKTEVEKIIKVIGEFVPVLKTNILGQQVMYSNVKAILKELKKINYRIDRLRSDLKLAKDNHVMSEKELKEKIDVSDNNRTDSGGKESN